LGQVPEAVASSEAAIVTFAAPGVRKGRGFLVETNRQDRLVVTAAHVLWRIPPPDPAKTNERLQPKVIGRLGRRTTRVCSECLFVDPIADVAVLGEPDANTLGEEWQAYNDFVESASVLQIDTVADSCAAWLLDLDGHWQRCEVHLRGGWSLEISGCTNMAVARGTSGSPILNEEGHAIGLISAAWVNPALIAALPGRLLAQLDFQVARGAGTLDQQR